MKTIDRRTAEAAVAGTLLPAEAATPIRFYFDFISPFGYFASLRIDELARRHGREVDWTSMEALYLELGLAPRLPTQAWRTSVPLYDPNSGQQVGYASSGSWSPLLKRYIALAHLEAPYAAIGNELRMEITVEHHRKRARARVAKLPFFNPERKRA